MASFRTHVASIFAPALALAPFWVALTLSPTSFAIEASLPLRPNDVIALVGGAAIVAEQREGELETALLRTQPELHLRVRHLAWEGDTVSSRPREVNYPGLTHLLSQHHATITFVQFGQNEAFAGASGLASFRRDYARLLDELTTVTPRLVLMTPTRFESPGSPLPNLTTRNTDLAQYVAIIREIGAERRLPVIDLFTSLPSTPHTTDGRQLSAAGRAQVAVAVARGVLSADSPVHKALPTAAAAAATTWFARPELRALRTAVVAKNQQWVHSVRPTNWAFLAGDRTEQLSSRDHRDRTIRWFPAEMEQFSPLLREAEARLDELAAHPPQPETR